MKAEKKKYMAIGAVTGFLNGLIGGGAGMLCVPLLRKQLNDEKKAHAYTVATILAASAVSTVVYALGGALDFGQSWKYLLGGALAAPIGVKLLNKASPKFIKKSFAVFMIYCAIRVFMDA